MVDGAGERVMTPTAVMGELAAVVRHLDLDAYSGADAARLTKLFARGERLCAAAKALAAAKAKEARQWEREGSRSSEEWLANQSGSDRGAAREAEAAGEGAATAPELEDALRGGELSLKTAAEIAGAAAIDPTQTAELLRKATEEGPAAAKAAARQIRINAQSNADEDRRRYAAIHSRRYLRTWCDADGAGRISALLPPDDLAKVKACLDPFIKEAFQAARRAGIREEQERYGADGLVAMAIAAASTSSDGTSTASSTPSAPPGTGSDVASGEPEPDGGIAGPNPLDHRLPPVPPPGPRQG
ncbi:MAG: hypothetical protein ACRDYC_06655, partial [Acidimicrobiales bacterium]